MAEAEATQKRPQASSLNAESQPHTTATGISTHGILNQHPSFSLADGSHKATLPFRVGVSEDCNKRWRRTMEDSHAFVYDFAGVHGQGFFGIFDGHAGKQAAEWCGHNFHQCLLDTLASRPGEPVPDLLNATFQSVDQQLSQIGKDKGSASGCTAVTAFLRLEDENGQPIPPSADADNASDSSLQTESDPEQVKSKESAGIFSGISKRLKGSPTLSRTTSGHETTDKGAVVKARRVLYTANVGDARAVLCRGGKAIRLTYDHKGSDPQEAKRITDAGGFVMNNRVNGVLAVTRSLGDSAMKEFVVGSPYTTETTLGDDDAFLIVACDGLWDVTDDQEAVDLVLEERDPQVASDMLLKHALNNFSTDNTSVMVIRFRADS